MNIQIEIFAAKRDIFHSRLILMSFKMVEWDKKKMKIATTNNSINEQPFHCYSTYRNFFFIFGFRKFCNVFRNHLNIRWFNIYIITNSIWNTLTLVSLEIPLHRFVIHEISCMCVLFFHFHLKKRRIFDLNTIKSIHSSHIANKFCRLPNMLMKYACVNYTLIMTIRK